MTLTPQVKFGISVLGGSLMEGYVTAGLSNTVSLGVSATASADIGGDLEAGFCYWADYDYSVFLSADVSFIGDLAYWGDSIELASPEDPLTLVETTCLAWSNSDTKKRASSGLVANTTGTPCFGGIIECSTEESTSCADDTSGDGTTEKRQTSTCSRPPGLFYNCDWFPSVDVTNFNEPTMTANPFYSFIGQSSRHCGVDTRFGSHTKTTRTPADYRAYCCAQGSAKTFGTTSRIPPQQ